VRRRAILTAPDAPRHDAPTERKSLSDRLDGDVTLSKRFIEPAEEVGADDEKVLERAFKKIISSPKKGGDERKKT
jgi:hypothetical protein